MLSAANEWPQKREGEEDHEQRSLNSSNSSKKMMMMAAVTATATASSTEEGGGGMNKVMEKPNQEQIQQQQQPLKCPRCESTNTKFCYYNNYSLTQPRHFCKACKRYWTRGGTLRSVPVGGGCRKNKRVRRPPSSSNSSSNTTSANSPNNHNTNSINEPSSNTLFNPSSGGPHLISPFLYGLPTNLLPPPHHHSNSSPHHDHQAIINGFPFSSYDSNHLGGLGLGFSSSSAGILGCGDHGGNRNINGYSNTPPPTSTTATNTTKQILQDLISNSNPSFHGSATTMSMSSLLTSSFQQQQQQQKFSFESLFPYELDLQIKGVGSHEDEGVKLEDGDQHPHGQCQIQNGYDHDQIHDQDHQQQPMGESDPSMLWESNNNNANGNSIGVNWLDPNNYSSIGSSSVPSLI